MGDGGNTMDFGSVHVLDGRPLVTSNLVLPSLPAKRMERENLPVGHFLNTARPCSSSCPGKWRGFPLERVGPQSWMVFPR